MYSLFPGSVCLLVCFFLQKSGYFLKRILFFFFPFLLSPSWSTQLLPPGKASTKCHPDSQTFLHSGLITHYEIPSTGALVCGFVIRAVIFPKTFNSFTGGWGGGASVAEMSATPLSTGSERNDFNA